MKTCQPFNSTHPDDFNAAFFASLSDYQNAGTFTDFSIKVNGRIIRCHRLVVAATIPYFAALLESGMAEAQAGEVTMNTMDYEVMAKIVDYVYGRQVSFELSDVQPAIEACEMLQMTELKEQLVQYVLPNINKENWICWWRFARIMSVKRIGDQAQWVLFNYLNQVSDTEEFKLLNFHEILALFSWMTTLKMSNRDLLLTACTRWLSEMQDIQSEEVIHLLQMVKIEECTSSAFNCAMKTYPKLTELPDLSSFINKALIVKLQMTEKRDNTRLVVMGGTESREIGRYSSIQAFINGVCWVSNRADNEVDIPMWEELFTIPKDMQTSGMKILSLGTSFVVMFAGKGGKMNSKYDFQTQSWSSLPNAPAATQNTTVVLCDNCIFALGGSYFMENMTERQDSVHYLDLATETWYKGPQMLQKQSLPIADAIDEDIYVVYHQFEDYDNANQYEMPATLQRYHKGGNIWEFRAPLPDDIQTYGASLVHSGKSLFLVGGRYQVCAQYTPALDTWSILSYPHVPHNFGAALALSGKIFLAGGRDDTIEVYNIENDVWEISSSKLPYNLYQFTMAMVQIVQ